MEKETPTPYVYVGLDLASKSDISAVVEVLLEDGRLLKAIIKKLDEKTRGLIKSRCYR